ncbi:MAG: type II toxin-antitoxin system VapC family toxin [Kiritimatiellae bacterium]|nr:type II toxin-antitoxin system VapC family toxin [Kiritimatiellia bacterium]
MKKAYIETSILSYLTARPSRDLLAAAHQQVTREWWDAHRERFEVFISPLVEEESRRGDPDAARRRVEALSGLPSLEVVDEAYELASVLISEGALPSLAEDDATHIALAAVHGVDYLLTWNCRHIDNAETKPIVRSVCAAHGYACPEICTPEELMGGENES